MTSEQGEDMSESIAVPAAGAAEATPTGPVVEAHELTRRYGEGDTAVDALRGVNLEVERGKLTAVMGPSGSGKSTLMHILAALDVPTTGYVVLAGTKLGELNDTQITKLRRAIARALVSKPTVVFADEPTGNLDSKTSEEILELLRASVDSYGQTTMMVTHDPGAAAIADRILFLADGLIVRDMPRADASTVIAAMDELTAS